MFSYKDYEYDDDEDYSQYKFVKSRTPKKETKKTLHRSRWDDEYDQYWEKR